MNADFNFQRPFLMQHSLKKRERFQNVILPLLRCILCSDGRFISRDEEIECRGCGHKYRIFNHIPLMTLEPEIALRYSDDMVVESCYSDHWTNIFKKGVPHPVLDLGSGNNPDYYPNLVKFEISPFPNIDVVGFGEHLPFKSDIFEIVFSGAVLEHAKNPFQMIENIKRVLRPGGEVYLETAFLQPVHSFPDHFFNMTKNGLEYMCSGFEKIASGVHPHQAPSYALSWILKSWASKQPDEFRAAFLKTTVGQIIDEFDDNIIDYREYDKNRFSNRWMEHFSGEDMEELASGVYYHGRKPLGLDEKNFSRIARTVKRIIKWLKITCNKAVL